MQPPYLLSEPGIPGRKLWHIHQSTWLQKESQLLPIHRLTAVACPFSLVDNECPAADKGTRGCKRGSESGSERRALFPVSHSESHCFVLLFPSHYKLLESLPLVPCFGVQRLPQATELERAFACFN